MKPTIFCSCLMLLLFSCGKDDSSKKDPKSMTVNSIQVVSYPMTDSGSAWDSFGGDPDMYLTINSGTSATTTGFVSGYISDESASSFSFSNGLPYTITTLDDDWTFGFWDHDDLDADDFMAGLYFKPSAYKKDASTTISLVAGTLDIVLNVTWNY